MNEKELSLTAYESEGCVYAGDEVYKKACLVEYKGKKYAINPNAMLTINCTAMCNAHCQFCYNGITFMRDENYVQDDSEELQRVIDVARAAKINVATLTGGEPTLFPQKLLKLARKVKNGGFPIIRMHTNGYMLNTLVEFDGKEKKLWKHLVDEGVNNISISMADYRAEKNKAIMGLDNGAVIDKYVYDMVNDNVQVRLSCYMCEAGVCSYEDLLNYINYGFERKIYSYIFRIAPEINKAGVISVDDIARKLKEDGWNTKYHHEKTDSIIYEFEHNNTKISLSCVGEEIDQDRKIRRLIYMPDKVVYTSWIDPTSFLFDDDAEKIVSLAVREDQRKCGDYPGHIWNIDSMSEVLDKSDYNIDCHVHSSVSDGLFSPTEVIKRAAHSGIKSMVFAEHNCLHDNPELLKATGKKYGVDIPLLCVEYNTVYCENGNPKIKMHMLIYGKNKEQFAFMNELYNPNSPRNNYAKSKYTELFEAGIISEKWDDIYSMAADDETEATRKMFLRGPMAETISKHEGISVEEAKDKYLPQLTDRERYEQYIDAAELIKKAHENGCVAVLAHPGWVRSYSENDNCDFTDVLRAIVRLAKLGLDGIEVSHRLNDKEVQKRLFKLATLLGLVITGGSDYHGKERCTFRENGTTPDNYHSLMERLK